MENIVILRFNLPALIIPLELVSSILPYESLFSNNLLEVTLTNGKKYLSYCIKFN